MGFIVLSVPTLQELGEAQGEVAGRGQVPAEQGVGDLQRHVPVATRAQQPQLAIGQGLHHAIDDRLSQSPRPLGQQ